MNDIRLKAQAYKNIVVIWHPSTCTRDLFTVIKHGANSKEEIKKVDRNKKIITVAVRGVNAPIPNQGCV